MKTRNENSRNRENEKREKTSGFSLLEILIAVVIITILGTVVGVAYLHQIDNAKIAKAKMQIGALKTAVILYAADNGAVPTPQQGLDALVRVTTVPPLPKTFPPAGYLDSSAVPKDPWERDYAYLVPGRNGEQFEIICYGADGEEGGAGLNADISSSK